MQPAEKTTRRPSRCLLSALQDTLRALPSKVSTLLPEVRSSKRIVAFHPGEAGASETILTFLPPSANFSKERVSFHLFGGVSSAFSTRSLEPDRLIASTQTRSSRTKFVGDDTWLFTNGRFLASEGQFLQFPVKYLVISLTNTYLPKYVGESTSWSIDRRSISAKCCQVFVEVKLSTRTKKCIRETCRKNIFFASLLYIARDINRKCTDLRAERALPQALLIS